MGTCWRGSDQAVKIPGVLLSLCEAPARMTPRVEHHHPLSVPPAENAIMTALVVTEALEDATVKLQQAGRAANVRGNAATQRIHPRFFFSPLPMHGRSRPPHWLRSAMTGSILVARRAGNQEAHSATSSRVAETAT